MENKQDSRKWLIVALSALIILCIGITIWALFFRDRSADPISPDYPPQGTQDNQTPITGDTGGKIDSPEGGGAIRVTFGTSATASLSTKKISLYYANPAASNQNVSLLLMVGETVVAKSELITPGHEIRELVLDDYAASVLQVGGYNAELVIRSYDPESGEKAMVDTKGEVTLTVTQ